MSIGAMYRLFRETGFFVGDDAQYCIFDHPDAALRGSLETRNAITGDGAIQDSAAYSALFKYCISKGLAGLRDGMAGSPFQTVFPFKSTFGDSEKMILSTLFFEDEFSVIGATVDSPERAACLKAYVVSEPYLTTLSVGLPSAIVVDIGSLSTRVVPVYEGVAINVSMRTVAIGGENCTDALERLLDGKGISAYSSSLPRRRKQIARSIKEKHAFVAESFDDAVSRYGAISLDVVRVIHDSTSDVPEALKKLLVDDCGSDAKDCSAITVLEQVKQPDGTIEDIILDRELFYCTEVLLGEGCVSNGIDSATEASIFDAILAAAESIEDYDMRVEICENVILTGGSSALPGLLQRFRGSDYLKIGLHKSGVSNYNIWVACTDIKESASQPSSSVLSGAQVRLAALQSGKETMDGGCVTTYDYDNVGSTCLDNLA